MNNDDPPVLSYYETLLRQSDIELLQGPHWLNDNIISFFFEYLGRRHLCTSGSSNYLFVPPDVTQCIKIIPLSQIKVFLEPLKSDSKRYIFFAFNDNDRPQTAGGTHWSLLVFARDEEAMYHYDSAQGSNRSQAEVFARKIFVHFGMRSGVFVEKASLQQRNGYDCGIYVVNNAQFLADCIDGGVDVNHCNLRTTDVEYGAKLMRGNLLTLIDDLQRQQQTIENG